MGNCNSTEISDNNDFEIKNNINNRINEKEKEISKDKDGNKPNVYIMSENISKVKNNARIIDLIIIENIRREKEIIANYYQEK